MVVQCRVALLTTLRERILEQVPHGGSAKQASHFAGLHSEQYESLSTTMGQWLAGAHLLTRRVRTKKHNRESKDSNGSS